MSGGPERARRLLARPGAWIESAGGGYALRLGPDRRSRVMMTLDEAAFRRLIETPGLRVRPGGGWTPRRAADPAEAKAGRPGVVDGVRTIVNEHGRMEAHAANLAPSPIAWLSGRRDARGQPWIERAERAERAAAERLAADAEIAMTGPSLTMRWDALPRSGGGSAARFEPGDRALAAARRVEAALAACGPARAMVEQVCIHASALQAAEQGLGLRRRAGKAVLKAGLRALAAHYRIG